MTGQANQEYEYCATLVRVRDEDRWLASRYAEPERRRVLMALYAFHGELRRIPASVSEPPLGEIRLQWWREGLAEIRDGRPSRAHPVLLELAAAGLASEKFKQQIDTMIDAAARPLYGEGFAEVADLTDWLARIDGAVDGLAALALGVGGQADIAARAGTGFALAREGRHWAPALETEIMRCALSIATETSPALRKAPAKLSPALLHMSLTRSYAMRGEKPFPLAKRLQLFLAMGFGRF